MTFRVSWDSSSDDRTETDNNLALRSDEESSPVRNVFFRSRCIIITTDTIIRISIDVIIIPIFIIIMTDIPVATINVIISFIILIIIIIITDPVSS